MWEIDVLEIFERMDCGGFVYIGLFRDVCLFIMDGLFVGWKFIDDGCVLFKYCLFWIDWGIEVYDGCEGRLIWGCLLLVDGLFIFCCCWYVILFVVMNFWLFLGKIFLFIDVLSCCCFLFNFSSFIFNCRFCFLKKLDMFLVLDIFCLFI